MPDMKTYTGQINILLNGNLVKTWAGISGNAKQRRNVKRHFKKLGYDVKVCSGRYRHQPPNGHK